MNIEYLFSILLSICAVLNHLITIQIYKNRTKAEKDSKVLDRKDILWNIIISLVQVNMGYNYLIRPLKLKQDILGNYLLITALVVYFIACAVFLLALWYYHKK